MSVIPSALRQQQNGLERRTDGYWLHTGTLAVRSSLELLPPTQPPGASATLVLPDGIITTPMIAPNAVQELIGSYVASVMYTLPVENVWTESPIQTTVTYSGAQVRVDFAFGVICTVKGQRMVWGIMVDGAAPTALLGALDAPEANYGSMASGTYYINPSPGSHRVAIGLYGPAGSSLASNITSTLYLTEQKR
jgi:hypothetical protein